MPSPSDEFHGRIDFSHTDLHLLLMRISHVANELSPKHLGKLIQYLEGAFPLCEEIILAPAPSAPAVPKHDLPTPGQLAILKLWAQGLSAMAIASELGISVETVKTQTKKACRRLGVRGGWVAAMVRCRELGLLS